MGNLNIGSEFQSIIFAICIIAHWCAINETNHLEFGTRFELGIDHELYATGYRFYFNFIIRPEICLK